MYETELVLTLVQAVSAPTCLRARFVSLNVAMAVNSLQFLLFIASCIKGLYCSST